MNKIILITRPNHDPTTNYLYHWCKPVIELANSKRYILHDLARSRANRAEFQSHLRSRKIDFILFNGHGNEKMICGHLDEPLVESGSDLSHIKGVLMYIRSCQVMSALGNEIIRSGALACIGYTRKFSFFRSTSHVTHPLSDPYAKFFLDPSNLVATTILKGNTMGDAYKRSQYLMKKNLQRLLSGATTPDQRSMAFALYTNLKGQVIYGDVSSKL